MTRDTKLFWKSRPKALYSAHKVAPANMKVHHSILIICLLLSCSPNTPADLPFEVTGSSEAMPSFQKGLLLLHNFEYVDAAEAFLEAQKIDTCFVMAYWGEAMTYNHPVWRSLEIEKARAALQKLGATSGIRLAKAKSELEKDFLTAIELLYGEGSKPDRDKAYSAYMEKVYERYEGNHEVAAFYALSLLGIKEGWNKWEDYNSKGASISEAILKENPKHPGALHYLIHSDDHPDHAKYALAAANDYAKVASYAGHALHMPSHIYLALGMWDDVIRANEVSWQAGVDRKNRKSLTNDDLNYHAHWWLTYGYLQAGKYALAKQLVKNQAQFVKELPSAPARFHLLQMKGHYLFETGDWTGEIAGVNVDAKGLALNIRSVASLIDGTKAFRQKDVAAMDIIIRDLQQDVEESTQLKKNNDDVTICGVTRFVDNIPSAAELKRAEFIALELKGMSAWAREDMKEAEKWLHEAIEKEDGFNYGPPGTLKPARELFGEFLLTMGRPKEAREQFEKALKLAPNRIRSLKGAFLAASQTGDVAGSERLENKISDILKNADEQAKVNL